MANSGIGARGRSVCASAENRSSFERRAGDDAVAAQGAWHGEAFAIATSRGKRSRHRWVVERAHAAFDRFRRLPVRPERRADIHDAFTALAESLMTRSQI
ncbi:hypothetical protein [Methylobacterium sp. E-041]|uniref:hypothetical protein n=1 Tax=Methylobacterium sp. E-041 TaxID=2836573 RepID=UPI00391A1A61